MSKSIHQVCHKNIIIRNTIFKNIQFKANDNYNLKGKGFINEAFDMTLNITNIAQEDKEFKSKLNNMLKNEDKK